MLSIILLSGFGLSSAYAHTTVQVEQYEIEAGWGDEPPVVELQNTLVIEIRELDENGVRSAITSAFKNLDASVISGGASKSLDINSGTILGSYYAKIIPTKTGTMSVQLVGELNGLDIDIVIPVEDVESQSILQFPQVSGSSSAGEIGAVKNALSSLQKDVSNLKSNVGEVSLTAGGIDIQNAYNFGVFGLCLGAAGVIMAVIAMIRRK